MLTTNPGSSAAGEKYKQNNKQQKPNIGRNREIHRFGPFWAPGGVRGGVYRGGPKRGFLGVFQDSAPSHSNRTFLVYSDFLKYPGGCFSTICLPCPPPPFVL